MNEIDEWDITLDMLNKSEQVLSTDEKNFINI